MSSAKDDVPRFKVTQPFFDGSTKHESGTELAWSVPAGWDARLNGPHYMENGPSLTFEPLNEAAEKLQLSHRERIRRANQPQASEMEQLKKLVATQNEQILTLMNNVMAENAERRKRDDEREKKR